MKTLRKKAPSLLAVLATSLGHFSLQSDGDQRLQLSHAGSPSVDHADAPVRLPGRTAAHRKSGSEVVAFSRICGETKGSNFQMSHTEIQLIARIIGLSLGLLVPFLVLRIFK